MPVQEFECQIARGQIGRYLNGEGLSSEGLRQLGAHVAECFECKAFLDHRKTALQGMLGEAPITPRESVRAVVGVHPAEALIAQIRAHSVEDEPVAAPMAAKPVKPILTKPIIYCGLLGVVLVGMTYMTRNPVGLLGPHASSVVAADPPVAAEAKDAAITSEPSQPPVTLPAAAPASALTKATPEPRIAPSIGADTAAAGAASAVAKPTDAGKPAGVSIAPTKPAKSPITIGTKPPVTAKVSDSTKRVVRNAKPTTPPKPAQPPANHAVAKPKRHQLSAGDRAWELQHPRAGTGTIRVYSS